MLIDTHCHLNMVVKKEFDVLLKNSDFEKIPEIIAEAQKNSVTKIINVGTSLPESINSIEIAKRFTSVWAAIGIHPNDLTENWKMELKILAQYLNEKEANRIIGIGECGLDFHYPNYNLQRQIDGFKSQIELALQYNLPLIVHTRSAGQETLKVLEEYVPNKLNGIIHCFSEDLSFAKQVISWGFVLGIGGTITYPKNSFLREIAQTVDLKNIVLETDTPFLPIQAMRGKPNHPRYILEIAKYIAEIMACPLDQVANQTTLNVARIFEI